jgi:hypothetical protein
MSSSALLPELAIGDKSNSPVIVMQGWHESEIYRQIGFTDGTFVEDRVDVKLAKDKLPCGRGRFWLLDEIEVENPMSVSDDEHVYSSRSVFQFEIDESLIRQATASTWEYDVGFRAERDMTDFCVYLVTATHANDFYELRLVRFAGPYQSVQIKGDHTLRIMQWITQFNAGRRQAYGT